jgi:hypothetical protein
MSKQIRILKIALNLAKINSFNGDLNVKKKDGTFNPNSNLAQLLNITQNKVKVNPGIEDLIFQLKEAKVDPNLIINEIIKGKLSSPSNDISTQTDEIYSTNIPISTQTDYDTSPQNNMSTQTEEHDIRPENVPLPDDSDTDEYYEFPLSKTPKIKLTENKGMNTENVERLDASTMIKPTNESVGVNTYKENPLDVAMNQIWEPIAAGEVAAGPDVDTSISDDMRSLKNNNNKKSTKRGTTSSFLEPVKKLYLKEASDGSINIQPGDQWEIP